MNSTNERKVIITGIGGQGIVFLTRLLSQTALELGQGVVVSETHGMSQRGGSVISHLKINGSDAPLIQRGSADVMIALDAGEATQNLDFMRRGGAVFVNSAEGLHASLAPHLERLDIRVLNYPATAVAVELGSPAAANIVMAGFVAAFSVLGLPYEDMIQTLKQISKKGSENNLRAIHAGFEAGKKMNEEEMKHKGHEVHKGEEENQVVRVFPSQPS
ncbi:MAG: 2-oxoacid:acceptor oxidoreductase family protein [Anaerolineae bacterium]|nr:2-oxoacid:acceptor oxidoreductase family protein [Anaerolineae bacterium]MBL8104590.1 2-oxoacid:acceptor oxidoreductase family protein [Anaerolineales bacterium]